MRAVNIRRKKRTIKEEIEEIARLYFVALEKMKVKNGLSDSGGGSNDYREYISRVRRAYHELDSLERTIINNEFFFEEYPYWWEKLFSRSTFYRLKKRSMLRFKAAFENEM